VRESGQTATAHVIDVEEAGRSSYYADVRFTTREGRMITAEMDVTDASPVPEPGNDIEVRYRAEDPSGTVILSHVDRFSYWGSQLTYVLIMSVLFMLPACVASGFGMRRRDRTPQAKADRR
jgi:hypothetical protein